MKHNEGRRRPERIARKILLIILLLLILMSMEAQMPGPGTKGHRTPRPLNQLNSIRRRAPQPLRGGFPGAGAPIPWWQSGGGAPSYYAGNANQQPMQMPTIPNWMTPLGGISQMGNSFQPAPQTAANQYAAAWAPIPGAPLRKYRTRPNPRARY